MSSKISCLIIDDEPLSQDLLIEHVERTPILELVGTANNGKQALVKCQELNPELLLLDIRMPRLSGFEFLDLLPKPTPLVVITSAYREYALKGYEHAVVDFLEKPIFPDRFSLAIQRVEERLPHLSNGYWTSSECVNSRYAVSQVIISQIKAAAALSNFQWYI